MNRGLVFYYSHGAWVRAAQASPQGVEGHSDLSAEGLLHKDELEREGRGKVLIILRRTSETLKFTYLF